jgi:hypothetical protein
MAAISVQMNIRNNYLVDFAFRYSKADLPNRRIENEVNVNGRFNLQPNKKGLIHIPVYQPSFPDGTSIQLSRCFLSHGSNLLRGHCVRIIAPAFPDVAQNFSNLFIT